MNFVISVAQTNVMDVLRAMAWMNLISVYNVVFYIIIIIVVLVTLMDVQIVIVAML